MLSGFCDIVIKLFHESASIFAVLKETLVVFHRRNFILEFGDLLFDFLPDLRGDLLFVFLPDLRGDLLLRRVILYLNKRKKKFKIFNK